MIQNFTVFTTYILSATTIGYSTGIHCNYITPINIDTDNFAIQEIVMNFSGGITGATAPFKFLNSNITGNNAGTGFTANKIYAVVQTGLTTIDLKPNPANWKLYDLTPQILPAHVAGAPLTASELVNSIFKIPIGKINGTGFTTYNLSYLNYPPVSATTLSFGDETYFLGNVSTEIHADVFVTEPPIILNLNEFNSSTNLTWQLIKPPVAISEIGIYDADKNLVAIGKLNDPITKDSSITRTILFALDF